MSLKKSATSTGMKDKFLWVKFGNSAYSTKPQIPQEEAGVKKSSTAERPIGIEPSIVRDSVESILDFKTNPISAADAQVNKENNLLSRVLHDEDKLEKLWSEQETGIAKKFDTPEARVLALSTFSRGQTSRNPIPRPETMNENSLVRMKTPTPLDDAANILERKTLLYSEPSYRPSNSAPRKEVFSDPRQLISILGDPATYKRNHVTNGKSSKKVQISYEPPEKYLKMKERNRNGSQRKHRFGGGMWDGGPLREEMEEDTQEQNTDSFVSRDPEEGLVRRDPSEHNMLEHLLEDNSPSFGTKDEKLEKENTIKQIEKLSAQSSILSKDFDPSLPSAFANMEISEGEFPDYDNMHRDFRRSRIPTKQLKNLKARNAVLRPKQSSGVVVVPKVEIERAGKRVEEFVKSSSHPETHLNLVRELYPRNYVPYGPVEPGWGEPGPYFPKRLASFAFSQGRVSKRSPHSQGHRQHPRHHHHRWRSRDLTLRVPQRSRYYDYPVEPESETFISPELPSFLDYSRFPLHEKFPRFPLSLMAERFVSFPRFPKISDFAPFPVPTIEKIKRFPEPLPIPPAIVDPDEEETDGEPISPIGAEAVSDWAPYPEPISEPEPTSIPELASIREIPPITEPKEQTPAKLDPKKTFDTGESIDGVKKSSQR